MNGAAFNPLRTEHPARLLALLALAGLLSLLDALQPAREAWGMGWGRGTNAAGVRSLAVLTQGNAQLSVLVWYPSRRSGGEARKTDFGDWSVRAEKEAPPLDGIFPLVLISHDSIGSALSSHETAAALATQGFIVITPTHIGDSLENAGGLYSSALVYHRPLQLRAALAAARADPLLGERMDAQRIGLLGIGAGALTALQLCGVDLDAAAYAGYCDGREDDAALCSRWAGERLAMFAEDLREIRNRHGQDVLAQPLPGVMAVGLLTPGWLAFADKQQLSGLRIPSAAFFAGLDELYPPTGEGLLPDPFLENLRQETWDTADHYSLSADCPASLAKELPERCGALQGDELNRARRRRDAFFTAFFRSALLESAPSQGK
ncbi:MAG: hypothetical protein FWG17_01865 [Desulfovibrionaceae bacterium]|nr:hypothetical protein [Desulfovibrionaceae bacterium]